MKKDWPNEGLRLCHMPGRHYSDTIVMEYSLRQNLGWATWVPKNALGKDKSVVKANFLLESPTVVSRKAVLMHA